MQLIHDINMLSVSFDQLRIIISSRPEASIKGVSCLRTVKMRRLDMMKRSAIIKKICDRSTASRLVDKMAVNSNLNEIVDTPLFTTLLCIVYRAEHRLPETVHEFYDLVFQTLLYRHDQQKEGYERPRKSGLGNHQFSAVFENFCIRTLLDQRLRLSQEKATEIIAIALAKEGADLTLADKYFDDLTKITCLLVKDGTEYQFLHKSIQEYFTARYIKRLPEERAQEFYQKIIESPSRIAQLNQTIHFLYEIDSYRSYKYFVLPSLSAAFPSQNGSPSGFPKPNCSATLVKDIFSEVPAAVHFRSTQGKLFLEGIITAPSPHDKHSLRRALLEHFDLLHVILTSAAALLNEQKAIYQPHLDGHVEAIESMGLSKEFLYRLDSDIKLVSCSKAIEDLGLSDEIAVLVNSSDVWKRLLARVDSMVRYLQRMDSTDLVGIV
jgi:hypothetical protein